MYFESLAGFPVERQNWSFCLESVERNFQTEKTRKALDGQGERIL